MSTELVEAAVFLLTQSGLLVWILSNHSARISNLENCTKYRDARGNENGRDLANLTGRFEQSEKDRGD